jgi:hypothetical protein
VGDHVGPNPVDRGKPGSKLHLVTDAAGLPLAVTVTAANTPDGALLAAMVDDVPALRTPSGRRRRLPAKLYADKAYDSRQSSSAAAPRDRATHRPARGRVLGAAWPLPLADRALPVVAGWLATVAGAVGPGRGAVFAFALVACAIVCFNRL